MLAAVNSDSFAFKVNGKFNSGFFKGIVDSFYAVFTVHIGDIDFV